MAPVTGKDRLSTEREEVAATLWRTLAQFCEKTGLGVAELMRKFDKNHDG